MSRAERTPYHHLTVFRAADIDRHRILTVFRSPGIQQNEAQFGEYPWMAAVLKEDAGKLVFLCGASLIGTNVSTRLRGVPSPSPSSESEFRVRVPSPSPESEAYSATYIYPILKKNWNYVVGRLLRPILTSCGMVEDIALLAHD